MCYSYAPEQTLRHFIVLSWNRTNIGSLTLISSILYTHGTECALCSCYPFNKVFLCRPDFEQHLTFSGFLYSRVVKKTCSQGNPSLPRPSPTGMLHSSFSSHPDTLRRLGSLLPVVCTHPRSLSSPAVVSPALAMVEEQEKKQKTK